MEKKNIQELVEYLINNVKDSQSKGACAKYVANALEYGGFNFKRQNSAYMYHSNNILVNMGFKEIGKGTPKTGDIYVQENTKSHSHDQIVMYTGNHWVSDFIQKSDQVYKSDAGTFHYYRYE